MTKEFFKIYAQENPYHERRDPLDPEREIKKSPMARDYYVKGERFCNDWMLDPDSFINKLMDHPKLQDDKEKLGIICDLATEETFRCLNVPYQRLFQMVMWDNSQDDKKGSYSVILQDHDEYGKNKLNENSNYSEAQDDSLDHQSSGSSTSHDAAADTTGIDDDIPF
tara:strand:- start:68 stop:568 length:501 start_codon:yes stop_codon:yes gene_type:complete